MLRSHVLAASWAVLYSVLAPFLGRPWFAVIGLAAALVTLLRWVPAMWAAAAAGAAGSFGLVIDLVATAGAGRVEDWPRLLNGLGCAVGAVLLAVAATATRRRRRGRCVRCGDAHPPERTRKAAPEPSDPPRWVRVAAWLGAASFLPYAAIKTLWALGVPIGGFAGPDLHGDGAMGALGAGGIDLTAVLGVLAGVLNLALVARWGQRFPRWTLVLAGRPVPRWIPLVPAWLGAVTLGPYGLGMAAILPFWGGLGYEAPWWIVGAAALGFGGFGVTAGIAAWWYQRRTRPVCLTPNVRSTGAGVWARSRSGR
ncbi:hypothetical protein Afil01_50450 [Actinorhabdospora filicis]|uniref:Uncharacterized protein n=1 Tax=Actinorhabdospora filicis TaxID=1785913 RepID=A0A9W6SQ01_9ACTN|nr:hypothetical protein [Actinorhabdospora filicis]GLZ80238.1 hypothetical protein Afil01_50450 [Actinorhabdospora filicis]